MLNVYVYEAAKLLVFFAVSLNFVHPKQNKTVRFSVGVVVMCAIMLPFVDIIVDNEWKIPYLTKTEIQENQNDEILKSAYERGVEEYISDLYDLSIDEVGVTVDGLDISSMKAQKVRIILSGNGVALDYRALETKIAEEFTNGGRCEVEFDI